MKEGNVIRNDTFNGDKGLTEVTLGSHIVFVGDRAFANCCNLAKVCIPQCVEEIGHEAFAGSRNIYAVECKCSTPPLAHNDMFDESVYNHAVLRVPHNSRTAYILATGWRRFEKIIEVNRYIQKT